MFKIKIYKRISRMIHSLSKSIAVYFFAEDRNFPLDVYTYGIEILMSSIIGVILVISIGILIDSFVESLIYIISLMLIRSFSGGYHAKTYFKCNLIYISCFMISIFIYKWLLIINYDVFVLIITILSAIIMFLFAPIENQNKLIDYHNRKKYKIISILFIVLLSSLAKFILLIFNEIQVLIIFPTLLIIDISMLVEKIMKVRYK